MPLQSTKSLWCYQARAGETYSARSLRSKGLDQSIYRCFVILTRSGLVTTKLKTCCLGVYQTIEKEAVTTTSACEKLVTTFLGIPLLSNPTLIQLEASWWPIPSDLEIQIETGKVQVHSNPRSGKVPVCCRCPIESTRFRSRAHRGRQLASRNRSLCAAHHSTSD